MTLTTEQLRARAKFWREKAVEAKWESVSIAQDMLLNADAFDELAANREAQPVAYLNKFSGVCMTLEQQPNAADDAAVYIPLYTAPPAPANAQSVAWEMRYWNSGHNCWHDWERITEEKHAELSIAFATDSDHEFRVLYDAPPAPAVPDGWKLVPVEPTEEMLRAAYRESGVYSAKAYRAMLAAAPEGGNDHDTRR
ncbi:hypothetical protein [Serratia marcescens]|uniref:hypothetical protein n=1 Tax=Serratia marcescens TaxID=615 RepID=UPI0036FFC91B